MLKFFNKNNMVNPIKKNYTVKKLIFLIVLHLGLAIGFAFSIILVISMILPLIFELCLTMWKNLFHTLIPLILFISSLLVIIIPNPIYSLIALIIVFLTTGLFLLTINIEFLAFIYLIVYIGAIAILFLFIIMLFNLKSLRQDFIKNHDFSFLTISLKIYLFFGLKLFVIIALEIWYYIDYSYYINNFVIYKQFDLYYYLTYINKDLLLFGNLFYTYYSYFFIIAGIILLVAMIGSIVLVLSTVQVSKSVKRSYIEYEYVDLGCEFCMWLERDWIKPLSWASLISFAYVFFFWYFKIFLGYLRYFYRWIELHEPLQTRAWAIRFRLIWSIVYYGRDYLRKKFRLVKIQFEPKAKRGRIPLLCEYEHQMHYNLLSQMKLGYILSSRRDHGDVPLDFDEIQHTAADVYEYIETSWLDEYYPENETRINPVYEEHDPRDYAKFTLNDYYPYGDDVADEYNDNDIHLYGDDLIDFLAVNAHEALEDYLAFQKAFKLTPYGISCGKENLCTYEYRHWSRKK